MLLCKYVQSECIAREQRCENKEHKVKQHVYNQNFAYGKEHYPFEQLGVEKRSMAGAVVIVPPVVVIGDVSVVAKEGLLDSSLSLCS